MPSGGSSAEPGEGVAVAPSPAGARASASIHNGGAIRNWGLVAPWDDYSEFPYYRRPDPTDKGGMVERLRALWERATGSPYAG